MQNRYQQQQQQQQQQKNSPKLNSSSLYLMMLKKINRASFLLIKTESDWMFFFKIMLVK